MKNNRKSFRIRDLVVVAQASEFLDEREPPLRVGNFARLNSGGPVSLVVDVEADGSVVLAYRNEFGAVQEITLPRDCVCRVSPV